MCNHFIIYVQIILGVNLFPKHGRDLVSLWHRSDSSAQTRVLNCVPLAHSEKVVHFEQDAFLHWTEMESISLP